MLHCATLRIADSGLPLRFKLLYTLVRLYKKKKTFILYYDAFFFFFFFFFFDGAL